MDIGSSSRTVATLLKRSVYLPGEELLELLECLLFLSADLGPGEEIIQLQYDIDVKHD